MINSVDRQRQVPEIHDDDNSIEFTFTFGDFSEAELSHSHSKPIHDVVRVKKNTYTDSFIKCKDKEPNSNSISDAVIIFGDFTEEDCRNIQEQQHVHEDRFRVPDLIQIQSKPSAPSTPRNYKKRYCFRCGHSSHTIERCVAVRHKSGEYIGNSHYSPSYPHSPSSSPKVLNDLRPEDFIFNISEIRDWMMHDYECRLDNYLNKWSSTHHSSESSELTQTQTQPCSISEDLKIQEILYLDYLTSNLLFESQARRYAGNYHYP